MSNENNVLGDVYPLRTKKVPCSLNPITFKRHRVVIAFIEQKNPVDCNSVGQKSKSQ